MDKPACFRAALLLCVLSLGVSCSGDGPELNPYFEAGFTVPPDLMGVIHTGYSDLSNEYDVLDEYGVGWVHRDFSWGSIEPSNNNWSWDEFDSYVKQANDHKKKVFGMLLYDVGWIHEGHDESRHVSGETELAHYIDYVSKTVTRYNGENGHGRVAAWSIWNEPNLDMFWTGTREEFYDLTRAAAAAIRKADPQAIIVGGAFNTTATDEWITGIFESGAMENVDYIAYHPYMPSPETALNIYNRFKDLVRPYGFAGRIWITEIGYPTAGTAGGTEALVIPDDEFPEALVKSLVYLAAEGPKTLFWYHLRDHEDPQPDNSEDWFGLFEYDLTPKRGAPAYKLCAFNLPGKTCRALRNSGLPDYIKAWFFQGGDGKHTLVICNSRPSRTANLTVRLPGRNQKKYDIVSGQASPASESNDAVVISGGTESVLFYTWETTNPADLPVISTP
ncbi:MAG: hypothetical protein LBP60_02140 [Spirochaetaceae bacterium]|jgi:hypothetical protein|nr:hypothetical protein [Spirochaetaceae bacterium]